MAQRKIPMRKDIVTGEMKPKKELVRVVKNKENEVSIDPKEGRTRSIYSFRRQNSREGKKGPHLRQGIRAQNRRCLLR